MARRNHFEKETHIDGCFCTTCGARLVHRHVSQAGEPATTLNVKAGCLDGITKEMVGAAIHIWTSSAVVDIPAGARQYEENAPYDALEKV